MQLEQSSKAARMRTPAKGQGNKIDPGKTDITATLSDALLLRILSSLPETARAPCGLVCQRWLRVIGKLQRSLSLLSWDFLESGRLTYRFPNLTEIDLTWASIRDDYAASRPVVLSLPKLIVPIYPLATREDQPFSLEGCIRSQQVTAEQLNRGLTVLASGCPDLKRVRFVDVSTSKRVGSAFAEWEFVFARDIVGHDALHTPKDEKVGRSSPWAVEGGNAVADVLAKPENPDKVGVVDDGKKSGEGGGLASGEKNAMLNGGLGEPNGIPNGHAQVTSLTSDGGAGKEGVPSADVGYKNVKDVETKEVMLSSETNVEDATTPLKGGGVEKPTADSARKFGKGSKQAEPGLVSLGRHCSQLREVEVHQCSDETITALVACQHVQVLRLVGTIHGFAMCSFTDVGLTILANKCRRLVKLDLSGCEASFAGIAAIAQCCPKLEDLTINSTGFHRGWMASLGFFEGLKFLRLEGCKSIDLDPGPLELMSEVFSLERLQLVCCDLRDQVGLVALLTLSVNLRSLEFQDCWGLDDDTFSRASKCRKLRLLSLDGCSLVTTAGLEAVALSCKELQRLRVVYCNNIRDADISPAFGDVVVMLKEFQWRPDTKSLLSSSTEIAQTGRWLFKA